MIYIISGSGAPNFGDELMLAMWVRFLKTLGKTKDLVVNTHIPQNTERDHGFKEQGIRVQDDVWQIAKKVSDGMKFEEAMDAGLHFFDKPIPDIFKTSNFVKDFENIKIFHIHGGGFIETNNSRSGFLLGFASALSKKFGAKIYGTGCGIEPFDLQNVNVKSLAAILDSFEFFECRDHVSAEKLLSVLKDPQKIINGYDDNFLEKPLQHKSISNRVGNVIHLSFSWPLPELCEKPFFDAIKQLRDQYESVIVWQSYPWKEQETIIKLVRILGSCEIYSTQELFNKGAPIKSGDLMFTYKFHPHFIAARLGASGYYFSDSTYYNVKHESILRLGSPFEKFHGLINISHIHNKINSLNNRDELYIKEKVKMAHIIYG